MVINLQTDLNFLLNNEFLVNFVEEHINIEICIPILLMEPKYQKNVMNFISFSDYLIFSKLISITKNYKNVKINKNY